MVYIRSFACTLERLNPGERGVICGVSLMCRFDAVIRVIVSITSRSVDLTS